MKEFIEKLIGRLEEKAIEHRETGFEMERKGFSNIADKQYAKQTTYLNAIEIVNQLAEEYKLNLSENLTGWIPTSERLPEKNAIVLTCDKDGWISVKVNMPYAGVKNDFESGYYTAWMPLPPAYVPKEGRE